MTELPFREIWACDFEYRAAPGERPSPLCMCARELRSGRELRLWRDQLLPGAPFDTGPNSVLVAYAAAAELSCFLQLGWPLPVNVLDLFAEHRVTTNGAKPLCGDGLIGALAIRGLAHIDAGEKDAMRQLILDQSTWSSEEQSAILAYCMSDVDALAALLPAIPLDLPFALLRGRYGGAVARMERAGIPIDVPLYGPVVERWDDLKRDLIADVDATFGIYDDGHFREARFNNWLVTNRVRNWPRTEVSGALSLDDDSFLEQIGLHPELPQLQTLRELRATLGRMRLIGLEIGSDGRNRTSLMPFQAVTGRNLPSASKYIFGPARWLRGFIKPPEGFGLAYLDFASEEVAIAAALSGDACLTEHYASDDPYMRFAVAAGFGGAAGCIKGKSWRNSGCLQELVLRDRVWDASALTRAKGRNFRRASEGTGETYPTFARWRAETVDRALLSGCMQTAFGWRRRACKSARPTELMNWPVQSVGAELMRIVCIAATEAGIELAAPVHDGFLIIAPLDRFDHDVARMRGIMVRASEVVTGGLPIRVESKDVRYPERFMDSRGRAMWDRVMSLLQRQDERSAA